MKIGIGLPATIPGVKAEVVLEWARKADRGPFSSLGIIDRIVYPNYEPMITLAAAAGATERIRLMTTVLLGPTRNTGILAKEAATLDAISGGRFTLGLGVGGREDDFKAARASFNDRGKRFEEQLVQMKRIWAGQPPSEGMGLIGPPPARKGGPELLIGGYAPRAISRAGRYADGFISGGVSDAAALRQVAGIVEQAWKAERRQGKPRLVAGVYYSLGPRAPEKSTTYLKHYYAFTGPMADNIAKGGLYTPEAVKGVISSFAGIGVDEIIFWPCIPELEQVDRLAQAVG